MNASQDTSRSPADPRALETRWALRLVSHLNTRADGLPPDVQERLRFARQQALARACEARGAAAAGAVGVSNAGALLLGSFVPWLQRVASVLPLLLLIGGLLLIQQWSSRERVLAAADVDTLLLADTLPPSAYGDPGFAEFLRSPPQP
ncbi:MAG: DUF3619 family protein [Rubrivivax sp.]|nr:DUF3619 family protein [Rubrivivax sp.]